MFFRIVVSFAAGVLGLLLDCCKCKQHTHSSISHCKKPKRRRHPGRFAKVHWRLTLVNISYPSIICVPAFRTFVSQLSSSVLICCRLCDYTVSLLILLPSSMKSSPSITPLGSFTCTYHTHSIPLCPHCSPQSSLFSFAHQNPLREGLPPSWLRSWQLSPPTISHTAFRCVFPLSPGHLICVLHFLSLPVFACSQALHLAGGVHYGVINARMI